jgi:hypothetical protein
MCVSDFAISLETKATELAESFGNRAFFTAGTELSFHGFPLQNGHHTQRAIAKQAAMQSRARTALISSPAPDSSSSAIL